jgi:hypothetical protein
MRIKKVGSHLLAPDTTLLCIVLHLQAPIIRGDNLDYPLNAPYTNAMPCYGEDPDGWSNAAMEGRRKYSKNDMTILPGVI